MRRMNAFRHPASLGLAAIDATSLVSFVSGLSTGFSFDACSSRASAVMAVTEDLVDNDIPRCTGNGALGSLKRAEVGKGNRGDRVAQIPVRSLYTVDSGMA